MPSNDKKRKELEPQLRKIVEKLNATFPELNLDVDEVVKKQLSDKRFELQERARAKANGTNVFNQQKTNAYAKYVKSGTAPKAFNRVINHMVKVEDTPENQQYNEKFFTDLARDDELGLEKRKQLAIEAMNITANVPYEEVENDYSLDNLVEFSMKHYDQVGVAPELNNVTQTLEFPVTDKDKFHNLMLFGQTMGGALRSPSFIAQNDSFLLFPFEFLSTEQINTLASKPTILEGLVDPLIITEYSQIRKNLNDMPEAIEKFKKDFPNGRPVFGEADLGSIKKHLVPKGGYEQRKQLFFKAADQLNKFKDPALHNLKAATKVIRDAYKANAFLSEDQRKDIINQIGVYSNMLFNARSAVNSEVGEALAPVFADLANGASLITDTNARIQAYIDYQKIDNAAKELFGVNGINNIKFGVTETSRVGHILTGKETALVKTNDVAKVSKAETFDNAGDNLSSVQFTKLAKQLCEYHAAYSADKIFVNVLKLGSAYLSAEGRSAQQAALGNFTSAIGKYTQKLNADPTKAAEVADRLGFLTDVKNSLNQRTMGNLDLPEKPEVLPEPGDIRLAHIGIWTASEDQLFPHTASPNDIKQGMVEDCFMLSALTHIAATNPQHIMNAMKDNGDGTVTVMFKNNGEPAPITVKKTTNKTLGVNSYASSSLWPQMIEKAYIGYLHKFHGKENSFSSINRKTTYDFMNAFGDVQYVDYRDGFGNSNFYTDVLYKMDSQGNTPNHPEGYLPNDIALYNLLDKHVTKDHETITVGINAEGNKELEDYAKSHGIRVGHAYSVLKTFEQNVNGKIKKFVQLRDPYATFRSTYDKEGKLVNDSSIIGATVNAGLDNMGTFNLELVDFQKMFNSFTGIPKTTYDEFYDQVKNFRKYYDNPLTPKEFDECKLPLAPVAPEEKFITLENEDEKSLISRLNSREGFNEVYKQVSNMASDLFSTDEWFVWTNTKKFNNMKTSVKDLIKTMGQFKSKAPTKEQLEDICNKFKDAADKASLYTDQKAAAIKTSGKDPSIRAVHRLTSSVNIKRLYNGEGLIPVGKENFQERLGLVVNDINQRCERFKQNLDVPHDQKTVEQMQAASEILMDYIAKNPKFINEKLLPQKTVSTLKTNIREMKEKKIVKPEPQVVNAQKPKEEPEKSGFEDFVEIF